MAQSKVKQQIKSKANPYAKEHGRSVDDVIQEFYRNRLLERVFKDSNGWLLKGGSAMLARVSDARKTQDIDLFKNTKSVDDALEELKQLASIDLEDGFVFKFKTAEKLKVAENQPYKDALQVTFDMAIDDVLSRNPIRVDLVTGHLIGANPEINPPENRMQIEGFKSFSYRLFPIANQLADKTCATLERHKGRPSSRTKDLVDIVIAITHCDINGTDMFHALIQEAKMRSLNLPESYRVAESWEAQYNAKAKETGAVPSVFKGFQKAEQLASDFVDPVLSGEACGKVWRHQGLGWTKYDDTFK
jgi:hypothetical protein